MLQHRTTDTDTTKKKPTKTKSHTIDVSKEQLIERAKSEIDSAEGSLRAAANAIAKAIKLGAIQQDIAKQIGRSQSFVSKLLKWEASGFKDDSPFPKYSNRNKSSKPTKGDADAGDSTLEKLRQVHAERKAGNDNHEQQSGHPANDNDRAGDPQQETEQRPAVPPLAKPEQFVVLVDECINCYGANELIELVRERKTIPQLHRSREEVKNAADWFVAQYDKRNGVRPS